MSSVTLDSGLTPWTAYEYSVSVTNKVGTDSADYQPIRTSQAAPLNLAPPTANVSPDQLYIIELSWSPPLQPNGEIIGYSLLRRTRDVTVEICSGR